MPKFSPKMSKGLSGNRQYPLLWRGSSCPEIPLNIKTALQTGRSSRHRRCAQPSSRRYPPLVSHSGLFGPEKTYYPRCSCSRDGGTLLSTQFPGSVWVTLFSSAKLYHFCFVPAACLRTYPFLRLVCSYPMGEQTPLEIALFSHTSHVNS